jgi:GR25 family glycosyltransferase involved in LPS biosynthesis
MLFSISLAFCFGDLNAGIEKHFRKIENKTGGHSMPNIDFIYVINLDKRPEKLKQTLDELRPYGIEPFRFSAVNGWELSFEAIDDIGVKYRPGMLASLASVFRHVDGQEYTSYEIIKDENVTYYCHSLSRGAIGCFLSHLSILQDAYDSGYNTIWVIEDDIRVVRNPLELSAIIAKLDRHVDNDWDILFTDNEIKGADGTPVPCAVIRPRPNFPVKPLEYYTTRRKLDEDLTKIGMRFGSHSMIVRRSGMKKILDYAKEYNMYFPYDIEYFLAPDIKLYQCNRDIVGNIAGGLSDNGTPGYENTSD